MLSLNELLLEMIILCYSYVLMYEIRVGNVRMEEN